MARNSTTCIPEGVECGPVPDWEEMVDINRVNSRNINTGGGSHGLISKPNTRTASKSHGPVNRIVCDHHPEGGLPGAKASKKGTNCKWRLEYELSTDGWVLLRWHTHDDDVFGKHNHPLKLTRAENRSDSATRACIPEEYQEFGRNMASSGLPASSIHRCLKNFAVSKGETPNWTRDDISRMFAPSMEEKVFDVTGLINLLKSREKEFGLQFFVDTDTVLPSCLETV